MTLLLICSINVSFSQGSSDATGDVPAAEEEYIKSIQKSMGSETADSETGERENSGTGDGINYFSYFGKVFSLIIVIGIMFLLFTFFKKKLNIQTDHGNASVIISSQTIGAGKWIQIVNIAGKYFILGVTNENINLIKEIDDPAEIERLDVLHNSKAAAAGNSFMDIVTDFFNRKNQKPQNTQEQFDYEKDSVSFLQEQKRRLKDIDGKNDLE